MVLIINAIINMMLTMIVNMMLVMIINVMLVIDHQYDVGDHDEAISWQGGLVKVDWPVEAVMPFSLTSSRHRHRD